MDTLMIAIESTSKDASKQVDTLVTKLGELQTALKNVSDQSKKLSDLSSSIKTVTSSSSVKSVSKDLGTVSDQLQNLGLSMSDLGNPTKTVESADSITKKYKTSIGQLVEISEKEVAGNQRVKVTLTEVADETKKSVSAFDLLQSKLSGTILKTKLFVSGLTGLVKGVVYFTQKAADYEESLNLFTVTMGDQAKQGVKWLEKFSNALYLDPTEVMQYMGSFNSLIKGLGTASDKSYLMSKNLTQLTYDLASFKNIKPEVAFQKLQSAISGEIEPLRNVGVALSENTLQELAYSLGLEANVRDLTEAQKAQLRYIQIMKSSTEWQTDMGRTLTTAAAALRILRQEFTVLSRAIGRVFIPIIMAAAPYVVALSQVLTDLANRLASLLGYEIRTPDYSKLTDGLKDLSTGVSDIGDAANKTKKQLNTMLAPFDELNVVQEKVEKTGSGLGNSLLGGDLGLDLPEYDALAKLTGDMEERVKKAKENLNDIKYIALGIGAAIGLWKLANFISDIQNATGLTKLLKKAVLGIGLITVGITLGKIGDQDIKNKDSFLKGIGEQLGGSLAFGAGVWLLTGNLKIGLIVAGIDLAFRGVQTMMDSDNFLAGLAETLGGIFIASGSTFSLLKGSGLLLKTNLTVTLAVTAFIVWAAVFEEINKLKEMEPTLEEISNAINEIFGGIPYAVVDSIFDAKDSIVGFFDDLNTNISTTWENITTDISNKWDTFWVTIGNTFDDQKQQWSDNWSNFKDSANTIWNIMTSDVETSWDTFWVNAGNTLDKNKESWSTKFTEIKENISTTWSDTWTNVSDTISTKWTSAKKWFSDNFGTKEDWQKKFGTILDGAASVLENLKTKFESWTAKIKLPSFYWDGNDGFSASGTIKKILETLNLPTSIPKLKVKWYEQGGFPSAGDLFFANENGVPEMVGRIGNQTAVANNDQITKSLTTALLSAISQYSPSDKKSTTVIYIGANKVFEGYGDYVNDENDRYGVIRV